MSASHGLNFKEENAINSFKETI